MTLTIGYIGFGKSTTRYHLPYSLIREHIQVKTIFNRKRKPELEKNYTDSGIAFTDRLEDVLTDPAIELIVICTPHDTHYSYAKQCLEHGKHVLIEKPFATTAAEAEELLAMAKEKGLIAMPYQNRRFDSDFLAVKDVLERGYIGDLVEIESHFDYNRPDGPFSAGSYYNGAFYGLGVHTMDQIISLLGRPDHVTYDIRSVRHSEQPDDLYDIQLHYGNTKAIVKTSHVVRIPYPKFILHGTKGSFVKYGIDQQEACLKAGVMPGTNGFGEDPPSSYGKLVYTDENGIEREKVIPTPLGDYGRLYDHLADAILNGSDKLVSDEETRTIMNILEKGFERQTPFTVTL